MSIAPHRGYSLKDSPAAYRQALDRVSGRPPTVKAFARWLLSFSFKDMESFSQKNWEDLQWEGAAFFFGGKYPQQEPPPKATTQRQQNVAKVAAAMVVQKYPWMRGFDIDPIPSKTDLIELRDWLGSLWGDLQKDGGKWIASSGWMAHLSVNKNGALDGFSSPQASSWLERFRYRTYEILAATEVGKRFRFCKRETCRRPFLSIKRQTFCSVSCSQHHRTFLYRTKNREQFREKRRAYYKKKQREKTGSPNLRIQTRKGVRG